MTDKSNFLSKSDEVSSDISKLINSHIHTKEHNLEIHKFMETKNLNKKSLSNNKSIAPSQVLIKPVPNNPYCSSITSQYAFNLTQISNFKVYFWTEYDDVSLNPCIEYWLTNQMTITADNWDTNQKTQVKKALDTFTTFIGTTSDAPDNMTYENCDIVCVLFPNNYFGGTCYGPYYIKTNPIFVDNKIVFFLNSNFLYQNSIDEGSFIYMFMIQLWGLGFGLEYTHLDYSGSTILPGVLPTEPRNYQSIGGYIQNNVFNTIMSNNTNKFFLPENFIDNISINKYGYPETIMPLDALALRWLYNIQEVPEAYVNNYGVQLIDEEIDGIYHSRMIVGKNQRITFGPKCIDIAFYLSNQYITFNNLNYLRFEYIRNLENKYSFYTKDIDATISVLNLKNKDNSYIFIENRALITDLTINLFKPYDPDLEYQTTLHLYIMDSKLKYSITGNTIIRNKETGKIITINNPDNIPINIYFNETTITRNINNQLMSRIKKKNIFPQKKYFNRNKHKEEIEQRIKKYIQEKNLDNKIIPINKSLNPSKIIIKDLPHNPYCSSITGKYVFDLSQISNFNIYFWTKDDNPTQPPTVNPLIEFELEKYNTLSVIDWSSERKIQFKKAFDIFTTFTGTTSTVIDNYENCDIVCVLLTGNDVSEFIDCESTPEFIKKYPIAVDNKIIFTINLNDGQNIREGSTYYCKMISACAESFGLTDLLPDGVVPDEDSNIDSDLEGSTIMPGLSPNEFANNESWYSGIAGYIQNTVFNTIMSYIDSSAPFFIPMDKNSENLNGYPQTILPLDALALRWMYNIQEIPDEYINTYGVNLINPTSEQEGQSAMIVGKNQTITFGSNNDSINFYLTNQWFTYYNLQPIKYEYNRPIEKPWSFYPRELDSTISTINLDNTGKAFIFLENRTLKTNLTINIQNNPNQVLNFYCMDCKQNYSIRGNVYRNRTTNKTFRINNPIGATVNVYFDK